MHSSDMAMAVSVGARSYWSGLARSYEALGSPLRPASEDIRFLEGTVASWAARHADVQLHALLLGVTPEIAEMRWPNSSSLIALDNSMPMAQAVWPGNVPSGRQVVCGDWCALPVQGSSCHLAIGDGSLNCLRYPDGFHAAAEALRDVLSDDGLLVLRCYTQPVAQERPEEVFEDMLRGAIPSFHHFKFRLLMALQPSTCQGIAVSEVYRFWAERNADARGLMARSGWEKQAIEMIELYRGSDTVHTFPTLSEFRSVLHEFFDEISVHTSSYNLGERCPILVWKPR